ncbi:hypothetical protein ACTFIR_010707 [Dictyostelium discoideum]
MSSTANNSQSSQSPVAMSLPIPSSSSSSSSSEKTKEKEKAKKKLAVFLDINLDSFKRFKGLSSFIANSDENEIDKVFKENSYQVYQTMLSTFSSYELGTYKGKHSYAEKEVLKLMELLKRILIHLEGFVKKGWQVKSIVNVLEKMLGIENVQTLRMSGFSVLLIFLEVMEKPDKYKLELFSSVIDFTPFTADYTNKIIFSRKVFSAASEMKRFIVMQSTEQPTKEDSTKLFEQIFIHTDKKLNTNNNNTNNNNNNVNVNNNNNVNVNNNNNNINSFNFWFELIKTYYLPVLYPSICKQNGLLTPEDTTGFISNCPYELQVVVINYLCNWITNYKQIKEYFFNNNSTDSSSPSSSSSSTFSTFTLNQNNQNNPTALTNIVVPGKGNISILLEIFKQSCRLPLKYYEVIKKSIQTFKYLFLENTKDLEFGEDLPIYQTFILNEMLHVFEAESQNFEKEREAIGTYIIDCVYKYLIEHYHSMTNELKEISLLAMLQGTVTLLRKSNPNKSVSVSLEQSIVSTTLYGWIKSKEINNKKLWEQFHQQFEEIYHRPEVIRQIKSKLLQVTLVLKELIYPLSQRLITKKLKDIRNTAKGGEPKSLDHQEVPSEVSQDPAIHQNIQWDVETCKAIWHCLLDLFRNLSKIKEPTIHEMATQIIVDIVDLFIRTEQEVEFSDYLDENKPKHLSLINIFGSRLFDTCQLDSKYTKGKVLALGCLCRLVCRHHPQYPISVLSHFYSVINAAMVSPSSNGIDLSWSIILNSSNIFNLSIPGANILIPTYLYKIKVILTLKGEITIPLEVRKKCIVIINSLIFYPNQFPNMDIYNQREVKGKLLGNDLTMSEMKKDIVEILSVTLKSDKSSENKVICVWGLSVFLMEEFNCNFNQDLVNEIVDEITNHTTSIDTTVARAALDSLSSIGLIFKKLSKSTIQKILVSLCTSILRVLPEIEAATSSVAEITIASHFHCLLDWISLDNSIFDDSSYAEFRGLMFRCIEEGLGLKDEMWSSNSFSNILKQEAAAAAANALNAGGDSKDHIKGVTKNLTIKKNVISKINDKFRDSGDKSTNTSTNQEEEETTKFVVIHDACETLLNHCLNFTHNFPSKQGAEFISSMIDEEDDKNLFDENDEQQSSSSSSSPPTNISTLPLFCVLNENALISVVEIPKPNGSGSYARLFIRDATGKYVWNFDCDYDLENQIKQSPLPSLLEGTNSNLMVLDSNQNSYHLINKYSNDLTVKPVEKDEKLNKLLENLSVEHPECLPSQGKFLNQPLNCLKPNLVDIFTKNQNELNAFIQREDSLNTQEKYALPPIGTTWNAQIPDKAKSIVSQSCRLLLSYLGFLDVNIYTNTLRQLESTNKLSRALTQLDITPGREILKIGVIYTCEGQDDQKEILRNDQTKQYNSQGGTNAHTSNLYRQFVDGLGWPVELAQHQGYMGGLDRKKTTGVYAPYYATPSVEAIFHDITLMPTNPTDSQQIHKKRHVGNDIVNIIWSEHIRDYNSTTITSQFNDALVIVYPLPNGLFRIQIYRKESKVPLFGPLIHGMAVNKELLPLLVRQTAINAYRYVRHNTPNYSKPYVLRKFRIKEIVDRYSSDRNYVDYIHSVASGSSNFPITAPITSGPSSATTSSPSSPSSLTPSTTPPSTIGIPSPI